MQLACHSAECTTAELETVTHAKIKIFQTSSQMFQISYFVAKTIGLKTSHFIYMISLFHWAEIYKTSDFISFHYFIGLKFIVIYMYDII
jgi:hypothetical protein